MTARVLAALLSITLAVPATAQRRQARPPQDEQPPSATAPEAAREGARDRERPDGKKPEDNKKKEESPADKVSVTHHTITVGGRELAYTATTGYIKLETEEGKERARVFHVAYTLDGVTDLSTRPVTFVFNGGPGSASIWLHMGAAGPRRVVMGDAGSVEPPPYRMADNESTWLTDTDLVFIDPVGTGYSRPAEGHEQREFSGLRPDIESVGEFIRLYTTRNLRWPSPKFLAGESYGTTRASGLAGYLQGRLGMYLNGIVLISPVLNFQTISFDEGNDLPYALYLPTYTATAWYHKKLLPDLARRDLADLLREVEGWSQTEYQMALALGDALPADRAARAAATLSKYTGLSERYIRQANLRVSIGRFAKELMRDERKTVGRIDSRFTGYDEDAAGERFGADPSISAITGPYTAVFNEYVRKDLGYENDIPYEVLTGRVRPWSYAQNENSYVNVADTLRDAINQNNALRVHVACGRYDLATPEFASKYTVAHLGLEPALQPNVTMSFYDAGHMMYVHMPSLKALHDNVAAFMKAAVPDGAGAGAGR